MSSECHSELSQKHQLQHGCAYVQIHWCQAWIAVCMLQSWCHSHDNFLFTDSIDAMTDLLLLTSTVVASNFVPLLSMAFIALVSPYKKSV